MNRTTLQHATRVAQLRAGGWFVEWQRVQYTAPSRPELADGGYWYIVAVCKGVPS